MSYERVWTFHDYLLSRPATSLNANDLLSMEDPGKGLRVTTQVRLMQSPSVAVLPFAWQETLPPSLCGACEQRI